MNASASDRVVHFNVYDLAKRWGLSPGTLNHWRRYGKGPIYLKIGGHAAYRLEDIEPRFFPYSKGRNRKLAVQVFWNSNPH